MQDQESGTEEEEEEGASEGAALEAAAGLAAVAALVKGCTAFLSPYLQPLLRLLFSPAVLACQQANCRQAAGSIRMQLAQVMPARLLLQPLLSHFDGAVQVSCAVTSPLTICVLVHPTAEPASE